MIFPFNESSLKRLYQDKLTVEHFFVLDILSNKNKELFNIFTSNMEDNRAIGIIMTLKRKGLINHDDKEIFITQDGEEYYNIISNSLLSKRVAIQIKGQAKSKRLEGFEEWWSLYPANSKWEDTSRGIKFNDLRPLRTGKEQCKKKYDNIINSNKISHIELIDCLKYEIKARKIDSLRKNQNQLCYMKNSLSYLNQEAYTAYIDEVKKNPEYLNNLDSQNIENINISHEDIFTDNSDIELGN